MISYLEFKEGAADVAQADIQWSEIEKQIDNAFTDLKNYLYKSVMPRRGWFDKARNWWWDMLHGKNNASHPLYRPNESKLNSVANYREGMHLFSELETILSEENLKFADINIQVDNFKNRIKQILKPYFVAAMTATPEKINMPAIEPAGEPPASSSQPSPPPIETSPPVAKSIDVPPSIAPTMPKPKRSYKPRQKKPDSIVAQPEKIIDPIVSKPALSNDLEKELSKAKEAPEKISDPIVSKPASSDDFGDDLEKELSKAKEAPEKVSNPIVSKVASSNDLEKELSKTKEKPKKTIEPKPEAAPVNTAEKKEFKDMKKEFLDKFQGLDNTGVLNAIKNDRQPKTMLKAIQSLVNDFYPDLFNNKENLINALMKAKKVDEKSEDLKLALYHIIKNTNNKEFVDRLADELTMLKIQALEDKKEGYFDQRVSYYKNLLNKPNRFAILGESIKGKSIEEKTAYYKTKLSS